MSALKCMGALKNIVFAAPFKWMAWFFICIVVVLGLCWHQKLLCEAVCVCKTKTYKLHKCCGVALQIFPCPTGPATTAVLPHYWFICCHCLMRVAHLMALMAIRPQALLPTRLTGCLLVLEIVEPKLQLTSCCVCDNWSPSTPIGAFQWNYSLQLHLWKFSVIQFVRGSRCTMLLYFNFTKHLMEISWQENFEKTFILN